jgi:hypothetical protein
LTLLAVPVFYSFFEDISRWPVFRRMSQLGNRLENLVPKQKKSDIPTPLSARSPRVLKQGDVA